MKNYYEILEVDIKASSEMIDKAFKLLAKRYHPDRQPDSKKTWAEIKFKELNEAYTVLSDEEARKKYDIELDYEKNSAIQALCAKNEHLQHLVDELSNELSTIKNNNQNSFYSNANNNYRASYNSIRPNNTETDQNVYDYYRAFRDRQATYYDKRSPHSKNRLKDLLALLITIFCIITIVFFLWKIPITNKLLVNFYSNNPAIKSIIDAFLNIFKK